MAALRNRMTWTAAPASTMTPRVCRGRVHARPGACRGIARVDRPADDPVVQKPFHVGTARGPWGSVFVAAGSTAVLGIALLSPRETFVAGMARRIGTDPARGSCPMLARAIAAVEAFLLDGRPGELERLPIALAGLSDWDRTVLGAVRAIPWGTVASYGGVAASIERHGAARAVGGAVGRNPIGLAVPCHRVIAADGTLGGYGGDRLGSREELLAIKRELLAREEVILPAERTDARRGSGRRTAGAVRYTPAESTAP